jgi:hypothetical protein
MFENVIKVYRRDKLRSRGIYLEEDGQTYSIEVRYELGGHNPFTYKTNPRGIVLSVCPMEMGFTEDGAVLFTSFTAFTGGKFLVKELNRFSQKALDEEFRKYLFNPAQNETVVELFERVQANREKVLAPSVPAGQA